MSAIAKLPHGVGAPSKAMRPTPSGWCSRSCPTDSPGVTLLDDWQMLGMRSTVSCGIKFDDVFVPDADVVGEPGGWINNDPRTFSCAYAANHLGSAQAAFDFIAGYIADRPDLRDSEAVKVRLGRMDAQLYAARSGLYAAAARLDRGDDFDAAEADAVRAMHLCKNAVLSHPVRRVRHRRCPGRARALPARSDDARRAHVHAPLPRRPLRQRLADLALGKRLLGEEGRGGSTPFDQSHAGA